MQSSINWVSVAITGVVIAALAFGARVPSDGWVKTSLRWTCIALLFLVSAMVLWNLTVVLFARREG